MRLVPIECVREGSKLAKTIYDDGGVVLLQAGVALNKSVIQKISALQILSIYINDEYTNMEIEDVIRPELRQKSITVVKETFNNIQRIKIGNEVGIKAILVKKNKEYFSSIYTVAEELLDNILSNNNILVGLVDIKSMDNYTYQHSVNVAVLSLVIGIGLKMPKEDLIDLCIGALIHDIGKAFIPKEIIIKSDSLTKDEKDIYELHTVKGFDYLSKNFNINKRSLKVALEHHERVDGNGYPKKIKGSSIHIFAKIVAIADAYDSLTSDCSHSRAIPAKDALEFIMAHVNTYFDFELVSLFSRIVIVFPAGTIVKLSNNDVAIVINTPANFPLRPKIKILKSVTSERIGITISLLNELSLVVSSVQYGVY